jgi:indolepyruvate ferredoxin oxidoreductase
LRRARGTIDRPDEPGMAEQFGRLEDAALATLQREGFRRDSIALQRAFELNAMQVEKNKAAFEWGRRAAHDPQGFAALAATEQVIELVKRPSLDETVKRRVEFLTAYQNAAYAQQYAEVVARVQKAEAALQLARPSTRLSEAVAKGLFKLMAIKDEYEVARLHADPAFAQQLQTQFEGDFKLHYHLAPPLLAKRNTKGELVKREFGPWVGSLFKLLRHGKALRGTALDLFGHTAERRSERATLARYRATVDELLSGLAPQNLALAAQIASLPEHIRGYGHIRARHLAQVLPQWDGLMQQWRDGDNAATPGTLAESASKVVA